jgi:inorganic pyrophosphatase
MNTYREYDEYDEYYKHDDFDNYYDIKDFDFLFNKVVADRGTFYYKNGAVLDVIKSENNYIAKVLGNYIYDINIQLEDDKIIDMKCSCPFYNSFGENCKHIYAVLKCINKGEYEESYTEPCVCPICKTKDNVIPIAYGKTTYFTEDKIKNKEIKYGGKKKKVKKIGKNHFYKKWYCKTCDKEIYNTGEIQIPSSYEYLEKILDIKINKPCGTKHPENGYIYPVNYGYVKNKLNEEDKNLDCYILGEFIPLQEFTGKCIAVIHNLNEEDKLVVAKEGKVYDDNQIRALTEFQQGDAEIKTID